MTAVEVQGLAVLFDQMADGICLADTSGNLLYMNPAAEHLLDQPGGGRRASGVRNACELLCNRLEDSPGHPVGADCPLRQAARPERAVTFSGKHGPHAVYGWRDDRIKRTERWQELRVRCVRVDVPIAGHPEEVHMIYIEDSTAEREFKRQKEDWRQMIAHDMRSPLTSIYAALRLLEEIHPKPSEGSGDDDSRLVDASLASCRKMIQLLDLYLDVAQLDAGAMPVKLAVLGLVSTIHEAITEQAAAAEAKHLLVEVNAEPDVAAMADPSLLVRVIENLIDNAIKYNVEGGKIAISARPDGDVVRLLVKDSGKGIDPKDLPLLFDRYYQAEARRAGRTHGNGLGLAYCKQAVERMGGAIEARSPEGGGAEFEVTLKAVRPS